MLTDAYGIYQNVSVRRAVLLYLKLTDSAAIALFIRHAVSDLLKSRDLRSALPMKDGAKAAQRNAGDDKVPIGQLAFKEEAAGKLRVFALVDSWTQTILSPLHLAMFQILKGLPNDGTFDQDASFRRCQDKAAQFGVAFGYDLSSATDRLPMDLQVSLLSSLTGSQTLAECWRDILVARDYVILENRYDIAPGAVRYAVGQPMGALSSWASLALTHHMVVQYASCLIGNTSK